MTNDQTRCVVDADGHVLEPADTWLEYLEPRYRDRAIRIARDEQGLEVLLIDGQPLKTLRGQLGALGGIDMDAAKLLTRGQISYAEGSPPGAYDPAARLRVMDAEGIDASSSIRPSGSAGKGTSRTAPSRPRTRAPTTAGWPSSAAPTPRGSIRWRTSRCSTPKARWRRRSGHAGTAAWESISRRTSPPDRKSTRLNS